MGTGNEKSGTAWTFNRFFLSLYLPYFNRWQANDKLAAFAWLAF